MREGRKDGGEGRKGRRREGGKEAGREGRKEKKEGALNATKRQAETSREKIRAKLGMRENSKEKEEGCNEGEWVPPQNRDN